MEEETSTAFLIRVHPRNPRFYLARVFLGALAIEFLPPPMQKKARRSF
jgi:hypothetical protein